MPSSTKIYTLSLHDALPIYIKRIVVASGPGSFTGVRIAVTIAKVWAYAKEVPLYAVSSLSVYRHETKPTICVLDARRERSFAGRSEEHTSELQSRPHLVCRLPPRYTLFPYTTLFRSTLKE